MWPKPHSLKIALVRDVRRLTSLVSAMLDLARLQNHAIEKRPIDLAVVTLDVLADFSPSALDAGIELFARAEPRGCRGRAGYRRLPSAAPWPI